ncbi:MAG: lytic transglycosylase domain-containing protein [Phycisphaerae bacterium]
MQRRGKFRLSPLVVLAVIVLALAAAYQVAHWIHESSIDSSLAEYAGLIRTHAAANGLPPALVAKVIRAESGGDPHAVSRTGARGLMQIMPIALEEVRRHRDIPAGNLTDPAYNIRVGTAYLAIMMDTFDNDRWLALAAYNAGPGRIAKLRKAHPDLTSRQLVLKHAPRETAGYVKTILED